MVLQKLSPDQTKWIFSRAKQITDKYMKRVPHADEDWDPFWAQLTEEIKDTVKRSRNDWFTRNLLLKTCLGYFEELEKEIKNNERQIDNKGTG